MTLAELSPAYAYAAQLLSRRLKTLRRQLAREEDPEAKLRLQYRIKELTPMLTQMNELTELTAHYYDRGFWRDEKYTV